jgi:hypothetical protein
MFGRAVEYMVGGKVQAGYPDILEYAGKGPGPDFKGVGSAAGQVFDITTYFGQDSHYARGYGPNLVLILYDAPSAWP